MIIVPETTTFEIDATTEGVKFAISNPGTMPLFLRGLDLPGTAPGTVAFRITRYDGLVTDGLLATAQSPTDGAPPSFAQVRYGNITPANAAATLSTSAFGDPRGAGGGVIVPTTNLSGGALQIGPGHSVVFETIYPYAQEALSVRLFWGEQWGALPHIASTILPENSAFTAAAYFNVPLGWTSITFAVSYTAHADSTGGRPAWRGSVSDGTNDYPMTTLDTTIDAQGQRIAYPMSDKWHTTVAANEEIRLLVHFDVPPGMPKVRLDVAEMGDATNRGTIVVLVTGQ